MLRYSLLLLPLFAILTATPGLAQDEGATNAPATDLFSLEGDQVGLFQNSVNLFTGEVAFSLPLVSLPGRGGLSAGVALSYSSAGTRQQVTTWNLAAPTRVVGLGWRLDIPKIVVDHKQTGTRTDDEFYLVEGGINDPLVLVRDDGKLRNYDSKNYKFWDIRYEAASETWTITKEDGTQYIYGDKDSERSTVQYLVKWGNWIGSSSEITGQQQHAMQWDLSEIRNLFGNAVTFTYEQVLQKVGGATGKEHTEASYLTRITNPRGQVVDLVYDNKTSSEKAKVLEYQEPHTEASEPDAYQERYERRYLDRVEVRHQADEEKARYQIKLGYTVMGSEDLAKRLLTSAQKIDGEGSELSAPVEFAYHPSGNRAGALRMVTTSQGPQVEYTYGSVTVAHSKRDFDVDAPTGYAEPQTWIGNDYVVVAWRQLADDGESHTGGFRKVKFTVYQWAGHWIQGPEVEISNVELEAYRYRFVDVVTGKDFFGIKYYDRTDDDWKAYLFHQTGTETGEWKVSNKVVKGDRGTIYAGDNFIALGTEVPKGGEKVQLKAFTWNGNGWKEDLLQDDNGDFAYTAANNYIISHDNDRNPDGIYFHYLDERSNWQRGTVPDEVRFTSGNGAGSGRSNWHAGNSFAVCMADDHDREFIFMWDEDYTLRRIDGKLVAENDTDPVFIVNNSLIGIMKGNEGAEAYRFDGKEWHANGGVRSLAHGTHFGADFFTRSQERDNSLPQGYLYCFDPNTTTWQELPVNDNLFAGEAAGSDYAVFDNAYFYRFHDGWKNVAEHSTSHVGQKYGGFRLALSIPSSSTTSTVQVSMIRNGKVNDPKSYAPSVEIPQKSTSVGVRYVKYSQLVGSNIVILYPNSGGSTGGTADTWELGEDASTLTLYKVVAFELESQQAAYPVTQVNTHTGHQSLPTTYAYTTESATMAPGGYTAQFNEVKVIPGSTSAESTPYGYTTHYFFNGLPNDENVLSLPFPEDDSEAINAANHYQKLFGMPYTVRTYDSGSDLVAQAKTTWHVYGKLISVAGESDYVAKGYYARTNRSEQYQDGFTQSVTYYYDQDQTGLPNLIVTTDSYGRERVTRNTYATDYDDNSFGSDLLRDRHVLSPVLKQEVKIGNQILRKSETHFALQDEGQADSPPVPAKTVVYPQGGNASVTTTVRYDAYGNLLQSQTEGGVVAAYLYGHDHTSPVAEVLGATYDQVKALVTPESIKDKEGSDLQSALRTLRTSLTNAHVVTRTYDPFYGNLTSVADPQGRTTYTHYDKLGRLLYVKDHDGYVRQKMEYSSYLEE